MTGFAWVYENNTLNSVTVDRIQEFNLNGTFTGRVFNRDASCKLPGFSEEVQDIAVDSMGSVYLLDNDSFVHASQVSRFDPGDDLCVVSWGTETGPGKLTTASSLAIDKDGFINVLDRDNSGVNVRKYNRSGAYIGSQPISNHPDSISTGLDFLRGVAEPFMYVARRAPDQIHVFGQGVEPLNVLETAWVDPNSFQLKTNDLALLAECQSGPQDKRIKMKGVAADGVSPLLLRLHLPESGTVRWKIADPNQPSVTELLGSLASLDSATTGLMVEVPVDSVNGEYIAFAVYTAPIDFERPSVTADSAVGVRPLRVTAEFSAASGPDTVSIVSDLTIERPTVVFLHGFLSGHQAWNNFKSIRTAADAARWGDGRHFIADYSSFTGDSLRRNAQRLEPMLQSMVASARGRGIASAQIDIISHSMGGLVLRRLADATAQDPFAFRSIDNMGRGYYHKALFLNAPHQGAPLADIAVNLRNAMNNATAQPPQRLAARQLLRAFARMADSDFHQLIGRAIDEMSLDSEAVRSLQAFTAPTHSHVGTGGSDLWSTAELFAQSTTDAVSAFIQLVATFTNTPELTLLLPPNQHDIAVLLDSQIGGLSNPNHYVTAQYVDGLHRRPLSSNVAGNEAWDWARRSVGDASFFASSLPGGSDLARSPEPGRSAKESVRQLAQAGQDGVPEFVGVTLRITTPPDGGFVSSGSSFVVTVDAFSPIAKAVVTYPGGAVLLEDYPLFGYVPTDSTFNGPFELTVLALMADSTMGRSEPVTITVSPGSLPLTRLEVTPPSVSLPGVGALLELRVVGTHSDGVQRDVSSSASGTTYTGFDPGVVSVTQDGVLRGSGAGVTSGTVQNGSFSQVVAVEVGDAPAVNNQPQARAGGPYQACHGQGANLDASGSVDFDGDPVTYSWDINGDGQFGDLTGATVHYVPPFIVNEHLIGLRVTDSGGATSEDYTTIQAPLSCFAGISICSRGSFRELTDIGSDGTDVYLYERFAGGQFGNIQKRNGTCNTGSGSTGDPQHPDDLDELAVDTTGVAYVIGDPAEERILRFGPGAGGELDPRISVFTTPYSLVAGIAVDRDGYLYGSDYETGTQHVLLRKFDQAEPVANLLASWNLTLAAGLTSAESLHVAVGPDSALFVGVGNEVLKGVPQGGSYILERRWGTAGLGTGQFRGVADVAVGRDGDVYVADHGNHRIQRFTGDGNFRSMRKGTTLGFGTSNGKFYHPTGVTVLDTARVAVIDSQHVGGPRVQIFLWGDAVPTAVSESRPIIQNALAQNYPNPFNPRTRIAFSVAENSHAFLAVYDVRGALVRTLVNEQRIPGSYRIVWDGRNDAGVNVASGVYFYRLTAGRFESTRKMLLLK